MSKRDSIHLQSVCRHFNDLSFGKCTIGISYYLVGLHGNSDDDSIFPCFPNHGLKDRCPHAEYPMEDDMLTERQSRAEFQIQLFRLEEDLVEGLCPLCGGNIEFKRGSQIPPIFTLVDVDWARVLHTAGIKYIFVRFRTIRIWSKVPLT